MFYRILFFSLTLLAASSAQSADDANEPVRAEFRKAYASVAQTNNDSANDSAALRNYILYPYLQEARLRRDLDAGGSAELDDRIEAFLSAHDKEAVSADLRRMWFASLAKRQEWERFLANYRDVNDPALHCYMLTARLALQRTENLHPAVIGAWTSATESRPQCEPVFSWLKAQNALTPALIEKRARAALSANNPGFARQMSALLPEETAAPINTWINFLERPRQAFDAAIASPQNPVEPAALLEGWIRLARSDPNSAMQRYAPLIKARALSEDIASRFALELALPLSWNRQAQALEYFARVRKTDLDDRGAEWYARSALWAGNWKRAAEVIDAMSPALKQQTKWRYWAARVVELRGKSASARSQYQALLKDDNYYAALAAARLKTPYTPQPHELSINDEQVSELERQPSFARAKELLTIDVPELRNAPYEEWRRGYTPLDAALRLQSIGLAARWRWHDQAILIAAQQGQFDDYKLLYPRPFDAYVKEAARITNLHPELIYAMLRQESVYRVDALSTAGAQGLMQLIADTAKRTLRRWPEIQRALDQPNDLTNPKTNIYIGAANLRALIDRYRNNIPLALAAYNAGPGAAERWIPKNKMDIDIWIENIPYNETRTYIQRIHWHSVVFGWLLEQKGQDTTPWLIHIDADSAKR